jgi:hypothetical protein
MAHDADAAAARVRVYSAIAGLGGHGWRFRSDIAAAPSRHAAGSPERAGNVGSRT